MKNFKNPHSNWDTIWSEVSFDLKKDQKRLEDLKFSIQWKKFRKSIGKRFGNLEGLKSIEIGAGMGDFSILLAEEGANVTLLDNSKPALEAAKKRFREHKLEVTTVEANVFELPKSLLNKFDISFSLGLCEHFEGRDRTEVFRVHGKVLKPGGITLISVPNKFCLPYRYWAYRFKKSGNWPYGLEVPFSRKELFLIGKKIGLRKPEIKGGSLIGSVNDYLLSGRIKRLLGKSEFGLFLDDYLGYALILVGEKDLNV